MLRLRDIMTTDVIAVTPQTSMLSAMQLFAARHVTGAPVLEGSRVVGVVSVTDLMEFGGFEASADERVGEGIEPQQWGRAALLDDVERGNESVSALMEDLLSATSSDFLDDQRDEDATEAEALAEHEVGEVMTRRILALPPDESAANAAKLMQRAQIHRVLVMERNRLVGIVTTTDIARAVADGRLVQHTYVFNGGQEFDDRGS